MMAETFKTPVADGSVALRQYLADNRDRLVPEGVKLTELRQKQMTDLILEHGTQEDVKNALRLVLPSREYDPQEAEREELRRRSNIDFDIAYEPVLMPGLPEPASLETFRSKGNKTLQSAQAAVTAWMNGGGPPMLTLSGRPGTGKTHLARAAAHVLSDKGEHVVFREEAQVLEELHRGVRVSNLDEVISGFNRVPWLIYDDLGTPALSDWGRGQIDALFNTRWSTAGRLVRTLVTTNMLSEDIPARIASRLGDVSRAKVVLIDAPDHRRNPES